MEKIKVKFTDFWPGFNEQDNYLYNTLKKYYPLEISDNPDVLFFSCYGLKHLEYDCHKVEYLAENMRPNFDLTDYSMSFDYLEHPRHLRLPLYVMYFDDKYTVEDLLKKKTEQEIDEIVKNKTGFCCFIVSNPRASTRIDFFHLLSKYKKVDSGGDVLNNIGMKVSNKLEFVKKYKFTIAFENSSYPGYTTEKVLEPLQENSIPIYWGNPVINKEMNNKSFVNYHDYDSFEKLIERIVEIDNNEELYRQYLRESLFNNYKPNEYFDEKRLADFFNKLVVSLDKKPISQTLNYKILKTKIKTKDLYKRAIRKIS